MSLNSEWMRRRWLDFRNGHSTYLIFLLTFVNFVVITYTLAIERFAFLEGIFPSMWTWGIVFIVGYIPAAIIIGHLHRKFQIPTETRQLMDANPFIYHVQPGREKLFNMPVSVLGFEAQVHSMRMQNAMADAIEKIAANTSTAIPAIPRFDQSFFIEYERAIHVTERLAKGDNILDILEGLKAQEKGVAVKQGR
ncbi:hypothetical protein [Nitrososphaera sp.]|nr:hypothetical protein [Nitrososphaera sp.]NWG36187.1 hypothetical protein [Nitrososphaera sp.]